MHFRGLCPWGATILRPLPPCNSDGTDSKLEVRLEFKLFFDRKFGADISKFRRTFDCSNKFE